MRAWIGVTDYNWFNLLRTVPDLDEVNFWQPGGNQVFKYLKPSELFLFKLKYPINKIVGGGFFAYSNILPVSLAWDSFGIKNGATSLTEMKNVIGKLKTNKDYLARDFKIGCILLEQPFFLPESEWLPAPSDWSPSIQQGKGYDLSVEPGLSLWKQLNVSTLLSSALHDEKLPFEVREEHAKWGSPTTVLPRLGQGSFRIMVTDAYNRCCAVTREKTLPALDAAHIKPYSESGRHIIQNGILLRRDLHALFDKGYVTVNTSMKFEVSRKIKEEYENGRDYYRLHGSSIMLPDNPAYYPSLEYLEWHNTKKYKG